MSGFQNAGMTKGIMILLGISTLATSLFDIKPYIHLQLVPHISKYHQFWRIAVHSLAFANSTELLMGELLLYNVGVGIERSFGSRKYASFILISSLLSTILAASAIVLLHAFGLNAIPAGPYGILFSLLWQQYRIVPSLYQFRVFGVEMSNKLFTWILALQLVISHSPGSIVISLAGLLAGYIYRTDTLFPLPSLSLSRRRLLTRRSLKTYRIPLSLYHLLSRLFSPLIGTSAPPRRSNRVLPGQARDSSRGSATAVEARPTFRSLLASRIAATASAAVPSTTEARRRTESAANPVAENQVNGDTEREARGPESATAAVGEWVNDLTGSSGAARAPTEGEIGALSNMFPNLGRDVIVRALQTNDYNTAQAVESLLEESG